MLFSFSFRKATSTRAKRARESERGEGKRPPCTKAVNKSPRFLFSYARSTISEEKIKGLLVGYNNWMKAEHDMKNLWVDGMGSGRITPSEITSFYIGQTPKWKPNDDNPWPVYKNVNRSIFNRQQNNFLTFFFWRNKQGSLFPLSVSVPDIQNQPIAILLAIIFQL